ncbi:hypothetical protein G6514_008804 [Epicoccum nigrum]|nr:hypothetical protein G6514_008804 [Epicoccum nigrum]
MLTSLVAVRNALQKPPSQHTPFFLSLVDNGKNRPYRARPEVRLSFGQYESDHPGLGKKLSPFETSKLPSEEAIRTLLIDDLQAIRRKSSLEDGNATQPPTDTTGLADDELALLNGLADPDAEIEGAHILSFPSPSLDEICSDSKFQYDDQIRETMTVATVLPRDTLLDLQHSNEGTTFTTLLLGTIVWFVWPPTKHNLSILQKFYEDLTTEPHDTRTHAANKLEGGVSFVQSTGEAVRVPPFCLVLCLSLKTSVLATYSVVTHTQLASMLSKLPLLVAWFETETDGESKRKDFALAFLAHTTAILEGKFESVDPMQFKYPGPEEGPLRSLLREWDDIKSSVARLLDPAESEQMITMWNGFLLKASGRKCWICGDQVRNKPRDLRKHYDIKHWSRIENTTANDHDGSHKGKDKQSAHTARPEGSDDDAMEVVA